MINKSSNQTIFANKVQSQTGCFLSLGIDMAGRRCLLGG